MLGGGALSLYEVKISCCGTVKSGIREFSERIYEDSLLMIKNGRDSETKLTLPSPIRPAIWWCT